MENALITGATKGIGRAIAFAFAKQGLNLAICSRNVEDLTQMTNELLQVNPNIQVITRVTDCSIKQQVIDFATHAQQQLGFIKVLVNNVGIFEYASILDDDDEAFNRQMNTNVMPAYELYRYFGKTMMAARKGHIFNICSVASVAPVATAGTYGVTKAALYSLSNIMRLEMQEHGVKVTAILPGSTLTESWAGTDLNPDRFVAADDVAAAIISCYNMSSGANVDEVMIKPVLGQL
ncbi:SDR family oxidoreductase [Mucilaginibacter sp. Bleaf8]|uniref:SDR family NAD(P)-dependent oxidoreductase n=1 Tax=Mucilaginibacter sp. Bleaf8 TaxID=2834430 RepID=UPI001BCB265E|nr:SDR family oxidoreductase [Mucilaginibacter sp. Bleaf8]MBS7564174.1 SDR family oxidoreductase [Mucilaginibacter sp. Bleaf8]